MAQTPVAFYATTGTRKRHIINPDDRSVMLCSSKLPARIPEFKVIDGELVNLGPVRNLPECKNCERKAAKLGIAEDQTTAEAPVIPVVPPPSEDEFVNVATDGGKVHSARANDPGMIPLCRDDRGPRQGAIWHRVNAPLSCSHCTSYAERRAARRAELEQDHPDTPAESKDTDTMPQPTPLMLEAMAEAAQSYHRRVPSRYTANTTAGLVTRGLATPGRENYLTAYGVEVLRASRPDVHIGVDGKKLFARLERSNAYMAELGFPKLALWGRENSRYYPNAGGDHATDLLEVPGVILFGWSCEDCASEPEKYDTTSAAQTAALQHAKGDTCVHAKARAEEAFRDLVEAFSGMTLEEAERQHGEHQDDTGAAGRGAAPADTEHPAVRAAVAALEAASHPAALITDEYDPEDCTGDGFMVLPKGDDLVYVYHLVNGQDVHPTTREYWKTELREYAETLEASGWEILWPTGRCFGARLPQQTNTDPDTSVTAEATTVLAEHEVMSELEHAEAPEPAAPTITYTTGEGWTIDEEGPIGDFRDARDLLVNDFGQTHTEACTTLDRAHLEVLNTHLPARMQVCEDNRLGGFEYLCMGGHCKRSGGHDSPGGAAMYATMHRQSAECWHWRTAEGRVMRHQGADHDPDTAVHYRPGAADQGAVCGAAVLSSDDPGMTADRTAVTCAACQAKLATTAGLPRRMANPERPSAIEQAARRLRDANAATDAETEQVEELVTRFGFPDSDQVRGAMLRLIRSGDLTSGGKTAPEAVYYVDDITTGTGHFIIDGSSPCDYESAKTALVALYNQDDADATRALRRATCEALSLVAGPGLTIRETDIPGRELSFGFSCETDGAASLLAYSTAQDAYQRARHHRRPGGGCPAAREN